MVLYFSCTHDLNKFFFFFENKVVFILVVLRMILDGSSQNPGIVQSRIRGRLTHWDRHLNNGCRSKISSTTPVHLGAVTEHLFPFDCRLKEQLTSSPTPRRYKEGMNVTFNVPTDKREERLQVYINGRLRRKEGKKTYKHTNTLTHTKHSFS